MRVLFVSQYFHPEAGATSELLSGIAGKLAARGFEVEALAGQPSYFGARSVPWHMVHEGVSIRRVWSTQLDKNRALGRVLNAATFSLGTLVRLLLPARGALTIAVTNPPLLLWACWLARMLSGRRYVVVIHDVYPEIAVALGALAEGGMVARLWAFLNRRALDRAERIIVLGRDMQEVIAAQIEPSRGNRIGIIANWADGRSIVPIDRAKHPLFEEPGLRDRLVVQYSGNIGRFHEIETILDAARRLEATGDFAFMFYGDGHQVDLVRQAAAASTCKFLSWQPFQPRERLGLTLTGCDVGLVTLKDGLSGLAVPSKLYGVLAAGKPVIVIGPDDCEAARVVREEQCGEVVRPGDGEALAAMLRKLRASPQLCADYGRRARSAFERKYDIDAVASEWEAMLEPLAAGRPPRVLPIDAAARARTGGER